MQWHTSTPSDGGECGEVSMNLAAMIPVRENDKAPYGPQLAFSPAAWSAFVHNVAAEELDAA
ncbi:DUF397 domain-containing protein [Streptomyces tateyamensis]|uniref:DUF397 domain-containing protein n=1 Tax=Streptomyces tateyamensis TaxID=565073 RepID=A0A2V4NY00_9ACTN|nr:DUF397 domain-containing protein [Streptomyces tateyamensis]PYC67360.1 DUF397 domain-containing protein [Streptomyces tateyamensis]